jgi:hypothetical protein
MVELGGGNVATLFVVELVNTGNLPGRFSIKFQIKNFLKNT